MGLELEKYDRLIQVLDIYKILKDEGYNIDSRLEIDSPSVYKSELSISPIESSSSRSTTSSDLSHFRTYSYDRAFF